MSAMQTPILGWEKNKIFSDTDNIRGDLDVLQRRIYETRDWCENMTKANAAPIWKRVEEISSWVDWLQKSVVEPLRLEHDALVRRVDEVEALLDKLPSGLRDQVTAIFQKLCQEQLAAIDRLCVEKQGLLAELEQQGRGHAEAAEQHRQETSTIAQQSVETIRQELTALHTYAEKTQQEFALRLEAAVQAQEQASGQLREGQEELARKLVAADAARAAAEHQAAEVRSALAGCDTFFGRVRWLCAGPKRLHV